MRYFLAMIFLAAESLGMAQGTLRSFYGSSSEHAKVLRVNDIDQYLEIYGEGQPLLLIHGSGQSIKSMAAQIDYFKERYQVIVPDCRGHGKTPRGDQMLTYELMARDLSAMLDKLEIDSAMVIGWSNGGIVGLVMAMDHQKKVGKLAAMGANITADTTAAEMYAYEQVMTGIAQVDEKIKSGDKSRDWVLMRQQLGLLGEQPDIKPAQLHKIKCPVLVLAGDKDVIKARHTFLIFENIPKAHLCIFPGETHYIPATNPDLFNRTVETFFSSKFKRPDTRDFMVKD